MCVFWAVLPVYGANHWTMLVHVHYCMCSYARRRIETPPSIITTLHLHIFFSTPFMTSFAVKIWILEMRGQQYGYIRWKRYINHLRARTAMRNHGHEKYMSKAVATTIMLVLYALSTVRKQNQIWRASNISQDIPMHLVIRKVQIQLTLLATGPCSSLTHHVLLIFYFA